MAIDALVLWLLVSAASGLTRLPLKRVDEASVPHTKYFKNFRQLLNDFNKTALAQNGIQPNSNLILYPFQHYSEITLGVPSQRFGVLFDTLSSDLWIFSNSSQNCSMCHGHRQYDSNRSTTYVKNGANSSLYYLYGNMWGFLSTETVQFAGMKIENQTFTEVTEGFGSPVSSKSIDGVFGLALRGLSDIGVATPLWNMVDRGLSNGIFTFILRNDFESNYSQLSELIFGGIDYQLIDNETLIYAPVISSTGYWQIKIDKVTVGDETVGCSHGCEAILASNFPGIRGPTDEISQIYRAIGVEPTHDCEPDDLPSISFEINGRQFTLDGKDYIVKARNNESKFRCVPMFHSLEIHLSTATWILGDTFLSKIYTIFDLKNERVGFANFKTTLESYFSSSRLKTSDDFDDHGTVLYLKKKNFAVSSRIVGWSVISLGLITSFLISF